MRNFGMRSSGLIVASAFMLVSLGGCASWFDSGTPQKPKAQTSKTAKPRKPLPPVPAPAPVPQQPSVQAPQAPAVAPVAPMLTTPALQPMAREATVALLLPLSGKQAALGQAMLNAAQLAVFDLAGPSFTLLPRDTGSTPESAARAAEDAIGSGADLIIGPLFAADVAAVKPIAATAGVPMLALSSDVSLAGAGAYVMGFAPAPMVKRTVTFAVQRRLTHFAALTPDDAYGTLVQQAFVSAVAQNQAHMIASVTYKSVNDIGRVAKPLVDHAAELDALFIPAGTPDLQKILTALTQAGFDPYKVKLLGSGLWDEPTLGQDNRLIGSWYAAPENAARDAFVKKMIDTTGQAPQRLSTLAYDATALAIVLNRRGQIYDAASLTNGSGFAGIDGLFRLTPQGTVERGLAIHEITANGAKILDPSPARFNGAGF